MADLSSLTLYTSTENGLFSHIDDISYQMLDYFFSNETPYLHNNFNVTVSVLDWQSVVVVVTFLAVCLSTVWVVFSDFYDGTVLATVGKG